MKIKKGAFLSLQRTNSINSKQKSTEINSVLFNVIR